MANSIRTPRQGKTASSRRIAEAVDDESWQKVRLSMKGMSTEKKIDVLVFYYSGIVTDNMSEEELENVKIRIDNYIKALCRGGQLDPGMTFEHFNDGCIKNHIRK